MQPGQVLSLLPRNPLSVIRLASPEISRLRRIGAPNQGKRFCYKDLPQAEVFPDANRV